MTSIRQLRIPRAGLSSCVLPSKLTVVLSKLSERGIIRDYKIENGSLLLWGDFRSADALLEVMRLSNQDEQPTETDLGVPLLEQPRHDLAWRIDNYNRTPLKIYRQGRASYDNRGEYFRLATHFMHKRRWRRLRPFDQEVWALHAGGHSFMSIANRLHVTEKKVRTAIARTRKAAGLPRVVSTIGYRRSRRTDE